jgi:AhpD family alkylhydroperoxidase
MEMPTHSMFSDKEQELIAIGASIAAGCRPCTRYHFRSARAAGADDQEIRQAVSEALSVRRSATEIIARKAANYLGEAPSPDTTRYEAKSLIGELVSLSAAYALNCVANLETHLAAARGQGASDAQILTTLKIARAVKSMAGKIVEDAAAKATGGSEDRLDDCGCQDGNESRKSALSSSCCTGGSPH